MLYAGFNPYLSWARASVLSLKYVKGMPRWFTDISLRVVPIARQLQSGDFLQEYMKKIAHSIVDKRFCRRREMLRRRIEDLELDDGWLGLTGLK